MANKNESKICDFSLTLCLHCCGDGDGVGIIFTNITAYTEHFPAKKERFKCYQIARNSRQPQKKISKVSNCVLHIFLLFPAIKSATKKMTEKKRIRSSSDSIMKNNIFCVCQKGCKMRYQRLLSNYSKYVLFLFRHSLSSVFLRVFFYNRPNSNNSHTKYTPSFKPIH